MSQKEENGFSRPLNSFAALMSDESEYSYEEEDSKTPDVPIIRPPAPKSSQKRKIEANEDEDVAFLEQLKVERTPEPASRQHRFKFNIALELSTRFGESSCEDCTRLPHGSPMNKFIIRRRNWPSGCRCPFALIATSDPSIFSANLTEYGRESLDHYTHIASSGANLLNLQAEDPWNIWNLMSSCRMSVFDKEFSTATDQSLRIAFVLQQIMPLQWPSRIMAHVEFDKMIGFLAQFAFRRGCFETSNELWKFTLRCENSTGCLCAAIPSVFAEDLDFLAEYLKSDVRFQGIPLHFIPDWRICHQNTFINVEKKITFKN
jgi:hypothetical protein